MLAFIVNQFPRQVDAYFLRELRGLHDSGLDFTIYSLLSPPKGWRVHEDARVLLERTVYPGSPGARTGAALRALGRHPGAALGVTAKIVAGHRSMPNALAKSIAVLPQSLYFAEDMVKRSVRHIHANWATYPATAALVISRLTGLPFSFSGHATDIFVHHAMLPEKLAAARFVITCTRYNRGYLAEIAPAHAERIRTVYHGVDLARFRPNGATRQLGHVLSVGTLRTCKGFDDLIRAIALLRDAGSNARLEIIGEGEERPALEALIRSLGLEDRVDLPGYRPQEDLIPAYLETSVVALPAHHEDHFGIPNILIEGLAAGAPVVCTELPSMAELVEHGKSGLFVPERDPKALADAIGALLADPEKAARLAAEGRRRVVENFDMTRTVAELVEIFRGATAREAA
ncbi:MAG: glycosyltransferase family 4 protein [Deltaproteobacteria bacterium]|nr:glycosyltransferase family 4 protein [Deltaproteobacteria bacterium]